MTNETVKMKKGSITNSVVNYGTVDLEKNRQDNT